MKMMKLFVGKKSKRSERYPFFEQKILTLLIFAPQSPQAIASQLNLSFIDTFTVLRSLEARKLIYFKNKRVHRR
ncbi:hypothetical protein NC997_06760 [Trichocoleus sp. DQ-A2]|uniref:hypothetical protein n=2 Tax=Cyanophyceae TaxID=3028117 RepID=UPI0019BEA194|nr:hypothetical protein [Coleofasciculus sp. FACHB-T130]